MHFRVLGLVAMLPALAALPAAGQQTVALQFSGGQVTLNAQNVPVRAILAEWARLGGATIVNGERVAGPPVTLELTGVSERQALDIVLRSVAGYIVAPRRAGSQGLSAFDRIVILPTSAAPRNPVPPPVGPGQRTVVPRPGGGFIAVPASPTEDDLAEESPEPDPLEDPSALVQGRNPRVVRPPAVMRPQIEPPEPEENEPADDGEDDDTAPPTATTSTPSNPFGVPAGSSATPGVIAPAPNQRPTNQRPAR
jgi:hypothetical protein